MTAPMHLPKFFVRQRITMMVNRYEIRGVGQDGGEGELIAFAQQKRMKLREEIIFYSDETRSRQVFSFKARQKLDVHAEHDVYDEHGRALGGFNKEFGKSLLRSTWQLYGPGYSAKGQERSKFIAVLRRIWTVIPYLGDVWVPFLFHFDFADNETGQPVMTSQKGVAIRDKYTVTVPDPRIDFRVAASMAVALDALQSR
ncbi:MULTISPECIES: hypothetical protein [Prauserella salsuginis group]|uniref:Uncharacterized protein YxjI n=2 Tax=Prauserella salsuginis group TaxID=2893672 RepID=A0A839XEL1_9PSEU|nr:MULTISPECIES: hypothetical protein [Prauserella salsuginis group]MBB3661720.1 uncharacterized protein YxjI [Prauserella sediminis]